VFGDGDPNGFVLRIPRRLGAPAGWFRPEILPRCNSLRKQSLFDARPL